MVDYPNHLVRCYILAHIHGNPALAARYLVVSDPTPNLAIEAVVVPLNHLFPILVSGKIFLSLALLLFIAGCIGVGHAITGRASWIALAVSFTFYNANLFYGFANYSFGIGVFLCIFAFWLRSMPLMRWRRFALLCALSLAAFLVHLSCIVFLAIACTTVAAMQFRKDRSPALLFRRLAWLAFPVLPMLRFMKGSGQVGTIEWPTLHFKIIHLFTPIRSYYVPLDALALAIGVLLVATLLRRGRLHPVALAGGVFFVMFLVTPDVLFTSGAADVRYVMPAFLIFMLAIEPVWQRRETLVFALFLAALVARSLEVDHFWQLIDRREARLLHMGDRLPQDAQVLVLDKSNTDISAKLDRGFQHVINLWTVSHEASVSSLFSNPGQQPILLRNPRCHDPLAACVQQYDYVWTDWSDPARDAAVSSVAEPVERWDEVTLWRVRR